MFYTREARANYYDCDEKNLLKISAAMKYMQQTSSEHLESIGISVEKLYRENMVFLLSKMCVKVHRMPACNERLTVGTAAVTPRGARFLREFIIDSAEGERLLSAMSLWALVDPATRRIIRPSAFPYSIVYQENTLNGIVDDEPLIKDPVGHVTHDDIRIRYSHIDVNHHVNNTVYADFVCDILPCKELVERGIDSFILSYQNEARLGETVEITCTAMTGGAFALTGVHGGLRCFEALIRLNRIE